MIRIFLSLTLLLSYLIGPVTGVIEMVGTGLLGPAEPGPNAPAAAFATTVLSVYVPSLLLSWLALRRMRVKERLPIPVPGRHWLTAGLACSVTTFFSPLDLTSSGAPSWMSAALNSAAFATVPLLAVGLALAVRSLPDRNPLDEDSGRTLSSKGFVPTMAGLTHLVLLTTSAFVTILEAPTLLGIFGAMDSHSVYGWSLLIALWLAIPLLASGLTAAILSIAVVVGGTASHRWRLSGWWLCAACAVFAIMQPRAGQGPNLGTSAGGLADSVLVVSLLLCILLPCLFLRRPVDRHFAVPPRETK